MTDQMGQDGSAPLAPLFDALFSHRRFLVVAYLVLLAIVAAAFWRFGPAVFPEGIHFFIGSNKPDSLSKASVLLTILASTAFIALQGLFLWGGGRIRLEMKPVRFRNIGVSLIAFSALMAVLTVAIIFTFAEMVERVRSNEVHRFTFDTYLSADWKILGMNLSRAFVSFLFSAWLCWLLIGWLPFGISITLQRSLS